MNKKLLIGLGIAAIATAVVAVAFVHELKKIRKLATDEEDADENNEGSAED